MDDAPLTFPWILLDKNLWNECIKTNYFLSAILINGHILSI